MTEAAQPFLADPPRSEAVQRLYDDDVAQVGHVMHLSRVWAHRPALHDGLFALLAEALGPADLRRRGVLVAACASAAGDGYCSLAWGTRLATVVGADTAAAVLRGDDSGLTTAEQALARWARQVARDPHHTRPVDVQALRDSGLTDDEVVGVTVFVALRLAFSTVNAALGAHPDAALAAAAPPEVREAVDFGRRPA